MRARDRAAAREQHRRDVRVLERAADRGGDGARADEGAQTADAASSSGRPERCL